MTRRAPRALLFDLDGTLIDSIDLIVHCYRAVVLRFCALDLAREAILPQIGRSLYELFEELAPGRAEAMVQSYRVDMLARHDAMVRIYAGIPPLLETLAGRDVPLGIVTSKSIVSAAPSLERFGLGEWMRVVVTYDDTLRHKPHPDPLLLAADRLGLPPAACWYVGDSTHDLHAAKAAGMRGIGALWGPNPADALAPLADALLQAPADLLRLLEPVGTISSGS